jgi:DNA-binding transcriptional ArsR family regulator
MVTYRAGREQRDLSHLLHAVADPNRRRILELLARDDLPVGRIAEEFRISRPAVIKHLRVLHSARLVSVRHSGRERIQCLNPVPLRRVNAWLARLETFWDESLSALKRQVERES